jgi:hypothetical protein
VHCDQLKLELQKAIIEIALYEETFKLMQNEIFADSLTWKTASNTWKKEVDSS